MLHAKIALKVIMCFIVLLIPLKLPVVIAMWNKMKKRVGNLEIKFSCGKLYIYLLISLS